MAYLSFSPWPSEHGVSTGYNVATPAEVSRFTALELRVIAMAERADATRELSPHSRIGKAAEWLFGTNVNRPLADPRLEKLRRFASLARHHPDAVVEADLAELEDAGFTPGQTLGLLAYLAPRQAKSRTFATA